MVFGGDLTNDTKSVVHAVASGKQAAMALDTLFQEGIEAIVPKLDACRVGDGPSLSMEIYMGGERQAAEPPCGLATRKSTRIISSSAPG